MRAIEVTATPVVFAMQNEVWKTAIALKWEKTS